MGGKRYYCDYCDRSLPYSVEARKKHNTGHQHRLVRQAYFNNIKNGINDQIICYEVRKKWSRIADCPCSGASEKFNEETSKSKCKRFFSGQNCAFGANCIFSHKTEPELENLKREVYHKIQS
ncbi:Zinc finger matrin-type protein 5 [Armadillidium vulgare]|nr:Zinc finger matrin-type protein 5 [Armadillidium vulgare]